MIKLNRLLLLAGLALSLGSTPLLAQDQQQRQGRGNFDPEQMRQRMMERYREQLDVKNDTEWKLISDRIEKVVTARMEVGGGFRGGRGGGGGGGATAAGGGNTDNNGGRRRGGGFGGGEPNPDADALQKAIDAKASSEELKSKLEKYRASRKEKEAKLEQAQSELRKVLSVRQEAAAVLAGLLK